MNYFLKISFVGQPWWLSGLAPPSARGVILETQDQVPRLVPCTEPASPSASCLCHCVVWVSFSYSFETIGGPQSASCSAVTTQWKPPDVLVWGMSWEFAATRGAGKWEGKAESQIFRVQPYSLLLWLMDDSGTTGHSEYLLGKCATPK